MGCLSPDAERLRCAAAADGKMCVMRDLVADGFETRREWLPQSATGFEVEKSRGDKTLVELFWGGVMTSLEPLAEKREALMTIQPTALPSPAWKK